MRIRTLLLGAAAIALAATPALAEDYASGAVKSMMSDKGEMLTDAKGMTLYTYDKDAGGMSNCYDKCATNWPPLMAGAEAAADGDFTLVERKDGAKQWAYKGQPLYLWIKDKAAGETTGDGVGGVWHTAME